MEVEVDMAVNSEEMELGDDYDEDDEEDVDPFRLTNVIWRIFHAGSGSYISTMLLYLQA